jgi:hypothetical protein
MSNRNPVSLLSMVLYDAVAASYKMQDCVQQDGALLVQLLENLRVALKQSSKKTTTIIHVLDPMSNRNPVSLLSMVLYDAVAASYKTSIKCSRRLHIRNIV